MTGSGKKYLGSKSDFYQDTSKLSATHSYLFWMSPMTCEYVFPMMLSSFTFTILSPVDKVPLSGFRLSDVDRQKERMCCTFVMMV